MGKKEIRNRFRNEVFTRDQNTCKVCGKRHSDRSDLDAHHITNRKEMPNGGYVKENGITVCKNVCHMQVERFHITGGEEWINGLHPDDLYNKIGSSYEIAYKESEKL
jgi:hypothetical protein